MSLQESTPQEFGVQIKDPCLEGNELSFVVRFRGAGDLYVKETKGKAQRPLHPTHTGIDGRTTTERYDRVTVLGLADPLFYEMIRDWVAKTFEDLDRKGQRQPTIDESSDPDLNSEPFPRWEEDDASLPPLELDVSDLTPIEAQDDVLTSF